MIVILGVAFAVLLVGIVVWLLLKRQIREKYAVLWIVIGIGVLVLGVFPGLIEWLTRALGVQLPSNLLFAIALVLLLGVALHLSWELSQAEDEIRRVAEETALLHGEIELLSARIDELAGAPAAEEDGRIGPKPRPGDDAGGAAETDES